MGDSRPTNVQVEGQRDGRRGGRSRPRSFRRRATRTIATGSSALLLATIAVACGGGSSGTPVVKWYAQKQSAPAFHTIADACTKQAAGRYKVEVVDLPAEADEARQQLARRLAAHDKDIDVMGMDVVWTAEFANAKWLKPWSSRDRAEVKQSALAAPFTTGVYQGRLYGAPLNTNMQILWYRKDLVPTPPTTWDQMIDEAEALAKAGKPHLIEVQANKYEGYIVWFSSLLSSAGTSVVDSQGHVSLATGPTSKALSVVRRLARSSAADPQISTSDEGSGSIAWNQGKAAFMVNYPFVYQSAHDEGVKLTVDGKPSSVFAQTGWAPWPGVVPGKPGRTTVGGFNLGVSSFSRHPDLAFDAARCLRSDDSQLTLLTGLGVPPSSKAVYDRPEVAKAMPYKAAALATLETAGTRPSTPSYIDTTLAMLRVIHPPSGVNPTTDVTKLRSNVKEALAGKGLF